MGKIKEVENLDEFKPRYSLSLNGGNAEGARAIMEAIGRYRVRADENPFFDLVKFNVDGETDGMQLVAIVERDNEQIQSPFRSLSVSVPTNLFSYEHGVCFEIIPGEAALMAIAARMEAEGGNWTQWRKKLDASNKALGLAPSPAILDLVAKEAAKQNTGRGGCDFLVDEQLARLPNGKADSDLQRSLMCYPSWPLNPHLVTRYHEGKHGHTLVYQPSEVERALGDAPEQALNALDRRFNQLRSETVADVIDILFHHWNTHKDTQTSAVAINAARLCQYRGVEPEGDNLRLHWEAMRDAFSITLRDTKSDINARVFEADSKGEIQDGPGARYAYRPGIFLEYALRGEPLYFAPFLQKVWALDPKKNNEAKRLARYLRGDWRKNTEKYLESDGKARAACWHNWAFFLEEMGINVEDHRKGANGPRRLMEKMARAVETLYQMEVIAEGGFDIYHPDDRRRAENLPARGALDVWLSLRVCLVPSAKLREALLESDTKRRAGRARDAKAVATERAKKKLRVEDGTRKKRRGGT